MYSELSYYGVCIHLKFMKSQLHVCMVIIIIIYWHNVYYCTTDVLTLILFIVLLAIKGRQFNSCMYNTNSVYNTYTRARKIEGKFCEIRLKVPMSFVLNTYPIMIHTPDPSDEGLIINN